MEDDPIIQRIREARHRISEACNHDPYQIVRYYQKLQKKDKDRVIQAEESKRESLVLKATLKRTIKTKSSSRSKPQVRGQKAV